MSHGRRLHRPLDDKRQEAAAVAGADHEPTPSRSAWITNDDVSVARKLRRLVRRDATGAELVQRAFGRDELVDDIGHSIGLLDPQDRPCGVATGKTRAASTFSPMADSHSAHTKTDVSSGA
jgi:hypothetical protein